MVWGPIDIVLKLICLRSESEEKSSLIQGKGGVFRGSFIFAMNETRLVEGT